jgi:uncharacterized protein YecE (DUF72 family)
VDNRTLIGTCGWSYQNDWKDVFYPISMKSSQFLEFYSQIFLTTEIDSTYYHIPALKVVENWAKNTPKYFSFSAKLPSEVTHKSKLKLETALPHLKKYLNNMSPLEKTNKMIAHLIQLPPSFQKGKYWQDLESFFNHWNEWREAEGKKLCGQSFNSESWRIVVEFRNKSWMNDQTFELLRRYNVGYCAVIEPELPPRMDITRNDIFYLRFHGYGKKPWWNYLFSDKELDEWAGSIKNVMKSNPKATKVAYFNNHFSGNAVKNAMDIIPKLGLKTKTKYDELKQKWLNSSIKNRNQKNSKNKKGKVSLDQWIKKKNEEE